MALRVIFAGTPEFAASFLQTLATNAYRPCAVFTQPDRPAGRGRKLTASVVKQCAAQHGIPCYQPASLNTKEQIQFLSSLQPDVFIVAAYGLLLSAAVLAIPQYGCINVHASLLPRWRGAAPIQYAILAGDTETGITIMQMTERLDAGAVLLQRRCPIEARDTAATLHARLVELGQPALLEALHQIQTNRATRLAQLEANATYAPKIHKHDARIDWTRSAVEIERCIRAYNPWPIAYTKLRGASLRIWGAETNGDHPCSDPPGKILGYAKGVIQVATGAGIIRLTDLQPAGGRVMLAREFVNAHIIDNTILGAD